MLLHLLLDFLTICFLRETILLIIDRKLLFQKGHTSEYKLTHVKMSETSVELTFVVLSLITKGTIRNTGHSLLTLVRTTNLELHPFACVMNKLLHI